MSVYEIKTEFTGSEGAPYLSTIYCESAAGTAQQAATAVGAFWGSVDAIISTTCLWSQLPEVKLLNTATGILENVFTITPATGAGGDAGEPIPQSNQYLIRLFTPGVVNGRRVRGRIFVPAPTQAGNENGNVAPGYVSAINTSAALLVSPTSADPCVWHRPVNGAGGSAHSISSVSTWSEFAVLRSRRQ